TFNLSSSADQPPPRRKYSRPNYNDSRTNSDGSAKYNFIVGAGFTLPVGGSHNYLTTSYNIQAAAARNFNKTFGVQVEFDCANFTIPTLGVYCDFFGFCYQVQTNQSYDKYTSNAFGVNGGLGFTYKFSRFAGERFFVEARYVYTFNSARQFSFGDVNGNGFNV